MVVANANKPRERAMVIDKGYHQGLRGTCWECINRNPIDPEKGTICSLTGEVVELYWKCDEIASRV